MSVAHILAATFCVACVTTVLVIAIPIVLREWRISN